MKASSIWLGKKQLRDIMKRRYSFNYDGTSHDSLNVSHVMDELKPDDNYYDAIVQLYQVNKINEDKFELSPVVCINVKLKYSDNKFSTYASEDSSSNITAIFEQNRMTVRLKGMSAKEEQICQINEGIVVDDNFKVIVVKSFVYGIPRLFVFDDTFTNEKFFDIIKYNQFINLMSSYYADVDLEYDNINQPYIIDDNVIRKMSFKEKLENVYAKSTLGKEKIEFDPYTGLPLEYYNNATGITAKYAYDIETKRCFVDKVFLHDVEIYADSTSIFKFFDWSTGNIDGVGEARILVHKENDAINIVSVGSISAGTKTIYLFYNDDLISQTYKDNAKLYNRIVTRYSDKSGVTFVSDINKDKEVFTDNNMSYKRNRSNPDEYSQYISSFLSPSEFPIYSRLDIYGVPVFI